MTREVLLGEYHTSESLEVSTAQLTALRALAGERLSFLVGDTSGSVVIRAGSHVGVIEVAGLRVRVVPKVSMRNVFVMLTADPSSADFIATGASWRRDQLAEGIAEFVLEAIDHATARGMLHGYVTVQERVPAVRGRLLVEQLATRPWDLLPPPCRYDEFSPDTVENRALRLAVEVVLEWPGLPFRARRRGRRLLERFERVSVADRLQVLGSWPEITRLNSHLQTALDLARLILTGSGISHAAGSERAHCFLVDINELYEKWVARELRRRLHPEVNVREQATTAFDTRGRVVMAPDIVFERAGRTVLVGDTKYKLSKTGYARVADYYQMLAYTVALGVPRGVLIYCSSNDEPHTSVEVRNLGQRLDTYRLPLDGTPKEMASRVDELASYVMASQVAVQGVST